MARNDDDDEDRPIARARRRDDDDDDDRPRRRRRRDDEDDEEEEGDGTGGLIPYKNPKALTSYYMGILGFFLPLVGSVLAIIFGFQGMSYAKTHPRARGQVHAIIGIIAGFMGAGFWLMVLVGVLIAIFAK